MLSADGQVLLIIMLFQSDEIFGRVRGGGGVSNVERLGYVMFTERGME